MKKYEFGMNYNPVSREEEPYLTGFSIPAETEEEAREKLRELIGSNRAKKCWLNDEREY